jgi:hypothetical protein
LIALPLLARVLVALPLLTGVLSATLLSGFLSTLILLTGFLILIALIWIVHGKSPRIVPTCHPGGSVPPFLRKVLRKELASRTRLFYRPSACMFSTVKNAANGAPVEQTYGRQSVQPTRKRIE